MDEPKDNLSALDFVYTGQRATGKDERCVSIRLIAEDGSLSEERWFKYSRKSDHVVGGIYRGARFSDTQAIGLERVSFIRRWPDEAERIEWTAKHEAVEALFRLKSLESDAGRISDLERALRDARKAYDGFRKRYDKAGMAALEQAVLAALRAPLRKAE